MQLLTAEESYALAYHTAVGEALVAWAWAMRACLPSWRLQPLPGAWPIASMQTVDDMRLWWRSGRGERERGDHGEARR